DPNDHRALRKLAETHYRSGKLRDAQVILCEQARTLPERAPDFSLADREELGRLLLEVGLPTEAAGVLQGVVAEKQDDAALWRVLSVALLRSGQRAAGIRAARRERKLSQTNSIAAMHNIAMALI